MLFGGDKGGYIFLKGISPKVNVIAQLEFKFTSYDVTVQQISHYTSETPTAPFKTTGVTFIEEIKKQKWYFFDKNIKKRLLEDKKLYMRRTKIRLFVWVVWHINTYWLFTAKSWLVGWFLWHINLCRFFNAKSIFMQIISSISNNSV